MKKSVLLLGFIILIIGCTAQVEQEISDRSLIDLQERGKIIVGSDVPYGVMEFFDENNDIVGIDVDIAREIATQLGVELEIYDYDWDNIFIDIKSGKLDIAVTSMTITPERSQEMLFSAPYFNGGQSIVVRNSDDSINSPDDLKGLKIGAQTDTTGLEEAKKYADAVVEYVGLDTPDETSGKTMWKLLESGDIDAVIVDYVAAIDVVIQNPSLKLAGEPFTQEFYGIPTKLGNNALIEEINSIIREMKRNGRLKEIQDKWIR